VDPAVLVKLALVLAVRADGEAARSLKRLIAAQEAASRGQAGDPASHTADIVALTRLVVLTLDEIGRLTTADLFNRLLGGRVSRPAPY